MTTSHTTTPWQINHNDLSQVCDADGEIRGCAPIATIIGTRRERYANTARIIGCVNAHDDLCAALQNILANPNDPKLWANGRAALAKATQ
jgi:hypothetical protein